MEWIVDPTAWLGLGTLILLEIVLGIDNLIFIAILLDKLPPAHRNRARIIGLSLALLMRIAMLAGIFWLQTLTAPVLTVLGSSLSVRDLILIAGGLFLLLKATTELHGRLEGMEGRGVSLGHALQSDVLTAKSPDRLLSAGSLGKLRAICTGACARGAPGPARRPAHPCAARAYAYYSCS